MKWNRERIVMAAVIFLAVAEAAQNTTSEPRTASSTARFGWPDYLVFSLMLVSSAAIGVYFGFFEKKEQDNTDEFLMAGKSMGTFPIAMSLIASFMSAITLLGTPSEVYQTGFIYYLIGGSYILVMPSAAYLYMPVFYEMQGTSAYEYLERRFSPGCRRLGSAVFIVQMLLYMAIVVFAPSLALSQVTGVNLYLSVCLICFVCMFYTTIGGMKAVLWTDTLQVVIMYFVMIFIVMYGAVHVGGFEHVWERAKASGRAELMNTDTDPRTRHTVWSLIIGGYFTWIAIYGVNQAQVQRYLCVRKIYMARRALMINMVGLVVLMVVSSFAGLVIYAEYESCDPIKSKRVTGGDQLFPLFVMETMGQFRGLPGLFVAGIFSGALSTVSSGMNSLAAIVLEDFVKGMFFPNISEKTSMWTSKLLTLVFGVITFALVFVAERLGDVLSAALGIFGMIGGPLLGMFTLGMFFPWANATGCFVGGISSLIFMFWIGIGYNVAKSYGINNFDYKITSTATCSAFNATTPVYSEAPAFWSLSLYEVSYMWYSLIGCFTVIIIGMIVSFITGKQDIRKLDPRTLSPGFHWFKKLIPGMDELGIDYEKKTIELTKQKEGVLNEAFTGEEMSSKL